MKLSCFHLGIARKPSFCSPLGLLLILGDRKTWPIGLWLAICLTVIHTDSFAQETDASHEVGIAKFGLPGIDRIGVPYYSQPGISVAASAGYGLIDKIETAQGLHHRIRGTFGIGAVILPQLALGIQVAGRSDFHPDEENGNDPILVGDPRFLLRCGFKLNTWLRLGAEFLAWIPGGDAPSLTWDATTLDSKLLVAAAPSDSKWNIVAMAGFRWDNSSNAAPDIDRLGPSERISIGLSDFDAVLVGLGGVYQISKVELIGEFTADLYIGDGSPSPDVFPWRIDAGVRYSVTSSLQFELLGEALLGKRPSVDPSVSLLPIEPRFSVTVGLSYTWGFGDRPLPATETVSDIQTNPVPQEPESASVEGKLVDEKGGPIVDATMQLTIGEETLETKTDQEGNYSFEKVLLGEAKLRAIAEDFEDAEWGVEVTSGMQAGEPHQMIPVELENLLKGRVCSFSGNGLKAQVTIKSLGIELQTDPDGYFQSVLPPGRYKLSIVSTGYYKQKKTVKMREGSVVILNVDMYKRKKR